MNRSTMPLVVLGQLAWVKMMKWCNVLWEGQALRNSKLASYVIHVYPAFLQGHIHSRCCGDFFHEQYIVSQYCWGFNEAPRLDLLILCG